MTNSKNSNLEGVSKGNDESAPRANDSTSDKKTRFNKSKSISKVFKELEFEDDESYKVSNDYEDDVDEIIPIHNEYGDLEESDAFDDESIEGGVIINPNVDDSIEVNVIESTENVDLKENAESIDDEASDESSESFDGDEEIDDEDSFIAQKDSDVALADEDVGEKIGKSSAQGVLINNKEKSSDSNKSLDIFDSSTMLTFVGFIVGLAILIIGITYYASSSDRVVDNVLSGETAGLAIFLVIIGLIIIGFSLLKFFSSSKSSLIIDTFNSIKSIDYDEVSEDGITREDFDAIFSVLKRKKDSNFSGNGDKDKSVDSSKDLFENDKEEELSDDDINSLYSDSNLTSQKNQSSFKEHENANSTEISDDETDDDSDEIIPIHSRLNRESDGSDLEDKYSKYDFEDDEDEFDSAVEIYEDVPDEIPEDESDLVEEDELIIYEDIEGPIDEPVEEAIEENHLEEDIVEGYPDSNLEAEKMDGLEEKYSKYDFEDDYDETFEESKSSKPQFKKSVDLSKFDGDSLSEEELAEKERKAQELEEKKRRIIEGTNFDNSLRKH
ncbi:MAG: hypothetical protein Q4Q24_04670 [Methanobrevibacter ruminantium]|uniref:hypothetical protein n=1 Tax=Methanobrevibacter ruminantium TaxID=83816 RepID=UPI0026EDA314|nr:hypothetical protein [Methanobrevibacter ruminantium]MDO5842539.1 hypothetical protein [Methanobrevibacter ruminantium]